VIELKKWHIQCTDEARKAIQNLSPETREKLHEQLDFLSGRPYEHGVPTWNLKERRLLMEEGGVGMTVWVSDEVQTLTVAHIHPAVADEVKSGEPEAEGVLQEELEAA
jgi:mRNA-degrading endonuclease RelE of RelBE toxin-antitoxin system